MIEIEVGSLTGADVECILRPVRTDLSPVSSASRVVEVEAGTELVGRLSALGELPVGAAIMTDAGHLPCAFLIHAVIQSPLEPPGSGTIRRALVNGLRRAAEMGVESLALPAIGTGAGSLDVEAAARVLVALLEEHDRSGLPPRRVVLVAGSEFERAAFESALRPSGSG